jgi:hypothetical protein
MAQDFTKWEKTSAPSPDKAEAGPGLNLKWKAQTHTQSADARNQARKEMQRDTLIFRIFLLILFIPVMIYLVHIMSNRED